MGSTLLALILMQYVVSVKAGLVNHVQGAANVVEMEQVRQGHSINTSRDAYAEVLLTPGSFLRIGENSSVVLDGVDLESVSLRVLRGPAVIEVIDISKKFPIQITTGNLKMNIVAAGVYRFEDGVATVLDGKLQTPESKLSYGKGWQVFFKDNYRARKAVKIPLTNLDVYSQTRSETISHANATLAASINPSSGFNDPYWLFSQNFGFYTFMPHGNHRSSYGYDYHRPGHVVRRISPTYSSNSGTNSSNSGAPAVSSPSNNTGSSNSNDSAGGGGGAAAPVTVSTPSGERSAPSVYIGGKNSPVGATQ